MSRRSVDDCENPIGQTGQHDQSGYFSKKIFKKKLRSACSISSLRRRVPIVGWLPTYKRAFLFSDFLAGVTVSLTVIPQGIAYAAVSGLPLQYGLYTALMAPLILVFFSTIPAVTLGPTAVMALMSLPYVSALGPEVAGLLSLVAGTSIWLCGLLNLGFLTELISGTVLAGFCSAAATRIMTMQFRQLLGLKIPGNGFLDVLQGIVLKVQEVNIPDFVLGLTTIALILFLKNLSEILKKCKIENQVVHKATWLLSISRNAIAIGLGCITSFLVEIKGNSSLSLTGFIQPGVPEFKLPAFRFNLSATAHAVNSSEVATEEPVVLSILESLEQIGLGFLLLAVVSILEHIAIAKTISSGQSVDSSQELCSLGLANIFGSLVGAFPVTASFARSAVQKSSGAKTPLCNFFVGVIVLLSIAFMTDVFYYIPKASLAAVIITAVAPMIEYHEVPYLWKVSKIELIPFFTTFFVCLFATIELGIIVGAGIHLIIVAFHTTRKAPDISRNQEGEIVLVAQRSLYFSGIEMLRSEIETVILKHSPVKIVVDFRNVNHIDATSMKALEVLFGSAYTKENVVRIWNMKAKIRNAILSGLGSDCMLLKGQFSSDINKTNESL